MMNLKKIKFGRHRFIYMNKSKKFKSIGISVVYKMKFDDKNISAFNILAKYLGNCSANYPSIESFNKQIDNLYGSAVGIKSEYVGSLFTVNFFINFINPKYIQDDNFCEEILTFFHDMIYRPLFNQEGYFQENIFNICKQNCLVDVESLDEYNMGYVLKKLKKTISQNNHSAMASSSLGDKKVLQHFNHKNILKYYRRLLHAPFDIYVTGEYSFLKMEKILRKYFSKKGIQKIDYSVFDLIEKKTYEPIRIYKNISQAKVAVAYRIPILFNQPEQYAFRIARLVLSGTLSSKFGKVIREKMGLCYSISSTYSAYYGTFIVTTGVSSENILKVIDEIDHQINELKKGNISDEEFLQAKEGIQNDLLSIDDTLFGTLNMIKTYTNFSSSFVVEEELKKYNQIQKEDVIKVSQLLTFCCYCVLDKESL